MTYLKLFVLIFLVIICQTTHCVAAETNKVKSGEADTKIAIVIGNSAYPTGALTNPKNDATAIASAFKKLGFEVLLKLDLTKTETDAAFKVFSQKAEKSAVAAFFYAGHGMQINGGNYIVPIDANPRSERDIKREMLKMDDVIDDMGSAKIKLVFFDACRDNPLSRSFSRGNSRGMAAPLEATGTLISFATKHGNTAADGDGKHSPYTQALLAELGNSTGMEIEQILRRVQQQVKANTRGQQEPWRYGSLDGDFFFQESTLKVGSETQQQQAIERAVNEALKRANDQASRERAELQQSMEKILKDALQRQTAALESERVARQQTGNQTSPQPKLSATPEPDPDLKIVPPQNLATKPMPAVVSTPSAKAQTIDSQIKLPEAGDTWEYTVKDAYGKPKRLTSRVKASVSSKGTVEEFLLDDKLVGEWVLDGKLMLLGLPIDSSMILSPFWIGKEIEKTSIQAGTKCAQEWTCNSSTEHVGRETITTAAGTFDTIKIKVQVNAGLPVGTSFVTGILWIEGWYDEKKKRLIKQSCTTTGFWGRVRIDETLELKSFSPAI